jgi:hypothetical protein
MTSLRASAAILAVFFGAAAALAQGGDPKFQTPPVTQKQDDAKGKATRKGDATKKQPAEAAEKKPDQAKPKVKAAGKKDKPKPEASDKDQPASKKSKSADRKSANTKTADDKSTNSVSTASAEVKAALRDAYAAIPPAERAAIQSDLIWTGDYNGLIDGQFSERLADAVMAYQKRQKAKPTGVLSAPERATLSATTEAERGRLARGRGPGDRRARRPAGQARDGEQTWRLRHTLELDAGPVAD